MLPTTINKTMTSREIADLTGKRHADVMRDVRVMMQRLEADANLRWHCETETYTDSQGKQRDQYRMDRDTTLTLVTGYDPIARMRIIQRWQELESGQSLPAVSDPALAAIVQTVVELDHVKRQQAQQAQQLTALEQRVELMDGDTGYMTVTAYTRRRGLRLPLSSVQALGRQASKAAKALGVQLGDVPDERFGTVKSYPVALLDEVFEQHDQAA